MLIVCMEIVVVILCVVDLNCEVIYDIFSLFYESVNWEYLFIGVGILVVFFFGIFNVIFKLY